MDADVYERPPTLLVLLRERPPAGDAAPPEGVGAGVVDVAQLAVVNEALDGLRPGPEAHVERDLKLPARRVSRRHHLRAFAAVDRQGLLTDDVLAGRERV